MCWTKITWPFSFSVGIEVIGDESHEPLNQPYQILSSSPLSPCPPIQSPRKCLHFPESSTPFFPLQPKSFHCFSLGSTFWDNVHVFPPSLHMGSWRPRGHPAWGGNGQKSVPWYFCSNMGRKLMKKPKKGALQHLKGFYIHTKACTSKCLFLYNGDFF